MPICPSLLFKVLHCLALRNCFRKVNQLMFKYPSVFSRHEQRWCALARPLPMKTGWAWTGPSATGPPFDQVTSGDGVSEEASAKPRPLILVDAGELPC
jgi:hypothetical protein